MTSELQVFKLEYVNNLYRVDTYFLAKIIAELPIFTIMPIIFTCILYPMVGLRYGFEYFSKAVLTVLLSSDCSLALGYVLSAISNNITTALGLAPVIIIPLMIFGGFLLQIE